MHLAGTIEDSDFMMSAIVYMVRPFVSFSRCCIDVDECTGSRRCQHNCHNTVGSYSCSCRTGYQLVGSANCRGEVTQASSAGLC